jgi:glycosyltransferase involved in cell wall biosynthesis
VQKLAEAITEMLRDRDFAERCGDNAMKIRSTHSMDVIAQEYMNYIEEALKRYQEKKQRSV